jgi:hypothetical protein
VEAAGIEPSFDIDATISDVCDCGNCQQCRAANALHLECFKSRYLASLDADLQQVVTAWPHLPDAMRRAIAALLNADRQHTFPKSVIT